MNRLILIILASLTLTACGGGGGGGGGSTASTGDTNNGGDTSNDEGGTTQEESFSQQQNAYLPLIDGYGWVYDVQGAGQATILASYDSTADEFSFPTEIDAGGTDAQIEQVISSSTSAISIERFEAQNFSFPLDDSITVTLNRLDFQSPIVILNEDGAESSSAIGASINVDVSGDFVFSGLTITGLTATPTITVESAGTVLTELGDLPGLSISSTLRIEGDYSIPIYGTVDIDFTVVEDATYVKGVGPVSRDISFYLGDSSTGSLLGDVTLTISDLVKLPLPIIFDLEQATAVAAGETTIRTSNGDTTSTALSPSDYSLLNQSEFNETWGNVEESTNGTVYVVDATAPESLPSVSTAEVIYITDQTGDIEIPVNVSLIVP